METLSGIIGVFLTENRRKNKFPLSVASIIKDDYNLFVQESRIHWHAHESTQD